MTWQVMREKLSHPFVTLGLVIALQLTRSLIKPFPWLVYPRLAINIWIIDSLLFRSRAAVKGSKSRFGLQWRLTAYVVGLLLIVGVFLYHDSPRYWAEEISPQPLQPIAAIGHAEVLLGSDELTIYQDKGYEICTICYYTTDGLAVAAAHASPTLEPEQSSLWIALRTPEQSDRQWAKLLANDDNGIVLEPDHLPDQQVQKLQIGESADISVGEVAHLYSVTGGSFPVRILGYTLRKGIQYLAIQPLDSAHKVMPGMSGSPIVQDSKLIGCVAAVPWLPNRGPKIALARLAADIYAASSQVGAP